MTRELGFRAWLKKTKEMVYNVSLSTLNTILVETEEHILLPFTGTTDKQHRKIFEGDILASVKYGTTIISGSTLRWTVYYNEERLCYYVVDTAQDLHRSLAEMICYETGYISDHIVIGNVHENPEMKTAESEIVL